ncbi:MAG: hypothetical protein RMK80_09995, partial [Pseudobdellovibrionaceae bacterium]|nr:hypothetical protein [Pseudobdellovibrionaceae bacterium]
MNAWASNQLIPLNKGNYPIPISSDQSNSLAPRSTAVGFKRVNTIYSDFVQEIEIKKLRGPFGENQKRILLRYFLTNDPSKQQQLRREILVYQTPRDVLR